jgi:hypothetical protein
MMDDTLVCTLSSGIKLYVNRQTAIVEQYATEKHVDNLRCFLADEHDRKEFVIVVGQNPEFASPRFEDIAVHIDAMAMAQEPHP